MIALAAGIGLLVVGMLNWVVVCLTWLPKREAPTASVTKRLSMSLILAILGGLFITAGTFLIKS